MTTKNLVPRADGEGKIGVKGSNNLTWKEINAVSGSFDELVNTAGNDLIAAGNNITITKTITSGSQYTISSQSSPITGTLEDLSQLSEVDVADKFIVSTAQGSFGYEDPSAVRSTLSLSSSDDVAFNTVQINSSPTNSNHAATKSYVDSVASGLDIYDSVRAATTASFTMTSTASTTTLVLASGEGGFNSFGDVYEVDGINLDEGDRVLIKNGVNSNNTGISNRWNGIYTVGDKTGSTLTLTRSTDMDVPAEFNSGAFFFVEEGTDNADAGFVLSTDSTVTVGTTDIEFVQFSGAGQILAGNALTKSGNTLNVDINGQTAELTIADADEILIYDVSASAIKKMTKANFVANLGSGSLSNIVEDNTPQLGGDLDVNGSKIVSTSNGDIEVAANGTGTFKITPTTSGGHLVLQGDGTNSGKLVLNCEFNSHGITIQSPDHSAAATYTLTLPDTSGTINQVLKTDGNGNLSWVDQSVGGVTTLSALSDVNFVSTPSNNSILKYNDTSAEWSYSQSLNLTGTITGSQLRLDTAGNKALIHDNFNSFFSNFGVGLSGLESTILKSDKIISVMSSLGVLSIIPQNNSGSNVYNSSLRLYDGGDGSSSPAGQNKNYISLTTPGKLSSTMQYNLPSDPGTSGQVLTTNGGNSGSPVDEVSLYWSTVSSSSSSLPSMNTESLTSGTLSSPASGDLEKIYIFDSSNALSWTVPNIANNSIAAGFKYNIKNIGTGQVTINAEQRGLQGGTDDTIDGQASITLNQYDSYTIVSSGSPGKDWYII